MTEHKPIETRLRQEAEILPHEVYPYLNPLMLEAAKELEGIRAALTICLHTINDYFGLSDEEVKQAIDEAINNPDGWTPHRSK